MEAGILIQRITRRLLALEYSDLASNWLVAHHLSRGTLEVLDGAVRAQLEGCA